MVIQIVYVNGATVRTGVEIEGSLVVRMLQYGDVVESFQRLKTKEGASFFIALFPLFSFFVFPLCCFCRVTSLHFFNQFSSFTVSLLPSPPFSSIPIFTPYSPFLTLSRHYEVSDS